MLPRRLRRREVAALVVAAVLGLMIVPLTIVQAGELPGETLRSELDGQQVRLSVPGDGIEPKGLVLWFHGQGGDVDVRVGDPFLETLRHDGWAIASSNFHEESWGNPASTNDVMLLSEWAKKQTGLDPSVFVAGSMGAAVSLNAMLHGVDAPSCWYGVRPALALTDMDRVPGASRFIREAFGGPVPEDRNPIENVNELPTQTRYRVIASRDDPWVAYEQNSEPFVAQLSAEGADVSEELVYGGHQSPAHFNPRDVLAFANSCLPDRDA